MSQVCRTCLEEVATEANYFKLSGDERAAQLVDQFNLCVPEVCLALVKNPVVCTTCASILQLTYNFKRKCLSTELTIKRMIDVVGANQPTPTLTEIVQKSGSGVILSFALNPEEENVQNQDLDVITDDESDLKDVYSDIDLEFVLDIEKYEDKLVKKEYSTAEEPTDCQSVQSDAVPVQHEEPSVQDNPALLPTIRLTRLPEDVVQSETVFINGADLCVNKLRIEPFPTSKLQEYVKPRANDDVSNVPKSELLVQVDDKPFACDECTYRGKSHKLLNKHKRIHLKVRPHCKLRIINNKTNLKTTLQQFVNKFVKCDYCKYKTKSQQLLDVHLKTHGQLALQAKMRLFKCTVCGYTTKTKYSLAYHKLRHDSDTAFGCIVCEYTTFHKHNLVKHMRRHSTPTGSTTGLTRYNFVHCAQSDG